MKVVFLCGGVGKRMFPIMEDKFLLKFLGKPLLEHQINLATEAGLKDFVVIGNPQNIDRIKAALESVEANVQTAVQKEPKGMADALVSAKELLQGEIIVINTNDVFDLSAYTNILDSYKKNPECSQILGHRVESYFPGGYLVTDEDGNLQRIIEKPGEGKEPSDLVNIVVHLHKDVNKLFEYIGKVKTTKDDVYEVAMDTMIKDGFKFKVVMHSGFWQAIKYPWHIFSVVEYFLQAVKKPIIAGSASISESAKVEGGVIVDEGARILENAVVRGPCYIGKSSIIGNNCLVWGGSHIGSDCMLGFSTEAKHSYISDGCWFHTNYVGDSVIGEGCSFGSGTVTANFRLDEKTISVDVQGEKMDTGLDKLGAIIGDNSKAGINASIMPGKKIGPNSIVGPQVNLREDLPPNKAIFAEQKYKLVDNKIEIDVRKKKDLLERLKYIKK